MTNSQLQPTVPDSAEVVVVGGGPAGSALSSFLARAGVDVLLVDRARFPRTKPCAEYLSPQASRLLDALGVLALLESGGCAHLGGMRIHAPDGTTFEGSFAARHGFRGYRDRGLALPRTVLDSVLLARAAAEGARIAEGVNVRDIRRGSGGRVVGVEALSEGRVQAIRARLVVGADGLRTRVGRRLGLVRTGRWPRRYAVVAHARGVAGTRDVGEMHVFPDGYAGLAPVGNGVTNLSVVVPVGDAASFRGSPEAFLRRWIERRPALAPRFAGVADLETIGVAGPFNQRARQSWAPGAALVGDAADFFDPFTGEGIYAALRGAELLAPFAFEAARSQSPRTSDQALAAYERARRREFGDKWRFERVVGAAVGFPALMNFAAARLAARPALSDLLVGVAGDFVPAARVLGPAFLARLLAAPRGKGPPASPAGVPTPR